MPDIGLFEAIHSQRAIRKFKPDPVPDTLVHKIIDAAIRAPSPVNQQHWRFIVVKDAAARKKICDLYEQRWNAGQSSPATQEYMKKMDQSVVSHAHTFATGGIRKAPMFLFVCAAMPGHLDSTLQAAQNAMLAARGLGLGTVFTTLIKDNADLKAMLGLPQGAELVCMLPVGYPESATPFGPTRRKPVEEVSFREKWGQALK